jgi:hypothetical protein
MPEKKDSGTIAALQEVVSSKQVDSLLKLRNVEGFGIANKITDGEDTEELGITVFVSQKLPKELLQKEEVVPASIGNHPTDVIDTGGEIMALPELAARPTVVTRSEYATTQPALVERQEDVTIELLRERVRPVEGGYSVGHYQITAGTYATAVRDAQPFPGVPLRYYVLSNNHVLANSNNARIGDPILQPGPFDGGTLPQDTIARLSRWVTIQFGPNSTNYVDAAIAEGQFHVLDREIYWIGYVRGAIAPTVGLIVQKTGRTTNHTTGRITAINATVNVNYGGGQVARFVNQIVTTNMSAGGDSGSLLLDLENRAVGLLFAGSSAVTIHNDIRYVQALLGIRIV